MRRRREAPSHLVTVSSHARGQGALTNRSANKSSLPLIDIQMSQYCQELSSVWGSLLPDSALCSSPEWGKSWTGTGRESSVSGLASFCSILSKCSETAGIHLPLHTAEYLLWRWTVQLSIPRSHDELLKKSCMSPWHGRHWHDREIHICFFSSHCDLPSSCLFLIISQWLIGNMRIPLSSHFCQQVLHLLIFGSCG